MTIHFSCENCGKELSTSDDKAGRRAKCPRCQEPVTVPEAEIVEDEYEFGADFGEDLEGGEAVAVAAPPPRVGRGRSCPMCGAKVARSARRCDECGEPIPGEAADDTGRLEYAGFGWRFLSFFIDWMLIQVMAFVWGMTIGILGVVTGMPVDEGELSPLILLLYAGLAFIWWAYFTIMEASPLQGTVGKLIVGLKVTDMEGRRVTFGRAAGRGAMRLVNFFTCLVGFLMAAFHEKRQALHDLVSGCVVVKKRR